VADNNQPLSVDPDNITTYRFVAYSHFGSTSTPSETSFDPDEDLVWGYDERTIEDTQTSRTVLINMSHLFAQVKVRVTNGIALSGSTVNITDLLNVKIESENKSSFDPYAGTFGAGSPATQTVNFDTSTPLSQFDSDQRTVLPVPTAPTQVTFGTIKVAGTSTAFSNQTVSFNATLDAATSYLLLVGVSPAQPDGFSGSTPIYVPVVNAADLPSSTWKKTTGSAMAAHASFPSVTTNWTTWKINEANSTDIPYLDLSNYSIGGGTFGRDDTFGIDADRNTTSVNQLFRGDICQYLSKTKVVDGSWRLPTSNELYPANGWTGVGWGAVDTALGNDSGTVDLLPVDKAGWAKNADMGGVVFPASGQRYNTGGLGYVKSLGYYWSGSLYNNAQVHLLYFVGEVTFGTISIYATNNHRSNGFPVRCVRN
jgi:hypothetical protein